MHLLPTPTETLISALMHSQAPVAPNKVLFWLTRGLCYYCGERQADTLDKLISWAKKLRHNTVPACNNCLRAKQGRSIVEWREVLTKPGATSHWFWGDHVGLPIPLAQHYNKADWS